MSVVVILFGGYKRMKVRRKSDISSPPIDVSRSSSVESQLSGKVFI